MVSDKAKGIIAVIAGIVVLGVGLFFLIVGIKSKDETAFNFVKRKGGQPTTGGGLTYKGYTFYSNNRVFQPSTGKKGNYTKTTITWDDGTVLDISNIF